MLRYFVSVLVALCWGLWFGGQILLFALVTTLLKTFNDRREIFGEAGSACFNMFNRYQLIVGAGALVTAFLLRVISPSGIRTALFSLFALTAVGVLVITMSITPRIDKMRIARTTDTPEFKKLHGQSMMVYGADTILLLLAGALLPSAIGCPRSGRDEVPHLS